MHASALMLSLALSALPYSKLGGYFYDPGTATASKVLAACPRVVVFVLPNASAIAEISSLASRCPASKIVVRVDVTGVKYDTTMGATQSALDYWNHINGSLAGLSTYDVGFVEGPSELENLPDWTGDATVAKWVADFTSAFADHVNAAGFHPLVGAIPSGAPKLAGETGATSTNLFKPIATAMKAKTYPWGWSYHAFSASLSMDEATEAPDSLRYRRIRTECALEGIPLIITEAGQAAPGWRYRGTLDQTYLDWFAWFDERLHEDADVVGAALYQFGGTSHTSFELDTIAAGLAALIAAPAPDAGPGKPRDAGVVAGKDAGKTGGSSGPRGGGGTPVEPDNGCSTAGLGTAPALASLLAYALWRRRKNGQ